MVHAAASRGAAAPRDFLSSFTRLRPTLSAACGMSAVFLHPVPHYGNHLANYFSDTSLVETRSHVSHE